MAFVQVASTTLSFSGQTTFVVPATQVRTDEAYVFTVRTDPVTTITDGLQVLCIPILTLDNRQVEAPLAAKFFPKGYEMYFAVPVPRLSGPIENGLGLLLILKRTGRRNPSMDSVSLIVSLNDERIDLRDANLPMQS